MNLICGINPVLEALVAGARHFDRLLIVKGLRNKRVSDAIARAGQAGIPLRFEARETLDRMAGSVPHQGVIAVVSAKPVIGLEELLAKVRDPGLVLLLDGVEDPRNLGAILRTAEAAGADGVLLPERHSAGLSETVARSSAGALDHVRVARIGNVSQAMETLKSRGFWTVGLDASGSERWSDVDYKRPIAIVVGGEGKGMRRLVRERCDHVVSLPLFGHVGSLNVSVAAGIALYEVIRQRGSVPSFVKPIPARPTPVPQVSGPLPGDGETDPGQLWARQEPMGGADDGAESDEDSPTFSVVQLHEDDDAAWRFTPAPRTHEGERRHSSAHGRPNGGESAAGEGQPKGGERPPGKERGDRGGGRPRGRRRPEGSRPPAADGATPAPPSSESQPAEGGERPAGERPAGDRPAGDRPPGRRGRRRRRRH